MRIAVRNLSKRYGDVLALDDVGFEIESGAWVALVGPNGSGKSTLNRALVGLLRYEGSIELDGASPLDDRLDIAHRIAYVPQVAPTQAAPVRDLVRALTRPRGVANETVAAVAEELGLDLEDVSDRPLRGLSGGMRQKLLLALALAAPVSLLILDEPTGSLDARTRERFFSVLERRAGDATVLLCSHREDDVSERAGRVIALAEGRLAYDGPADSSAGRAARRFHGGAGVGS